MWLHKSFNNGDSLSNRSCSSSCALELEQPATDDQQEEFLGTNFYGYKLVGDNVRPSFQRDEHRGLSLHHFHTYGVKDRISMKFFFFSLEYVYLTVIFT